MDDQPYTTPDEDPFNVQPVLRQPRRRRSSLLDKWIIEQQTQPSTTNKPPPAIANLPSAPTRTHPYLAYPDLNSRIYLNRNNGEDDEITLNSYDIVDDEDIPQDCVPEIEIPSTPTFKRNRISSVNSVTPSSFRHFSVSFRAPSTPSKTEDVPHQNLSRLSLFSRGSRQSFGGTPKKTLVHHSRSASESVRSSPALYSSKVSSPSSPPKWRPSVLGHFSQSAISVPSDTLSTPSRPSISSADTNYTASSLTGPSSDSGAMSSASRPSLLESVRPHERSPQSSFMSTLDKSFNSTWSKNFSQSSPSIRAYSKDGRVLNTMSTLPSRLPFAPKAGSCLDNVQETEVSDSPHDQPKKRDSLRPSVAYSSKRSLSRIHLPSLSSRHQKKKKLVVSGIQPEDTPKFEGVKRWCENFGELRQIIRMPNGDLHVDFCLAEVADTVCRLRAKVYINGVGSVHLSWYYSDRR